MASVIVRATTRQEHASLPGTVISIYLHFHLQRATGLKGGEAKPSMLPAGPSISCEGHSLLFAQEQGFVLCLAINRHFAGDLPMPWASCGCRLGSWHKPAPNTKLSLNVMFFRVLVLAIVFGRFPSLPLAAVTH